MHKTNIMILTCSLNIGGGEKIIYNLISNIDKQRFKFVVVCLYELGAIGEMLLKEQNIKIYHNVMKNRLDIFGIFRLIRIMRNEETDILFMVHTPLTLFWGILCSKLTGIRISITRSPTTNPTGHVKRRKIVNYLVLRYVNRIIAQAYSHMEYQIEHESAALEKIVVIYNGVDTARFNKPFDDSALRRELGIHNGVPVVGIVARLLPQKDITFLLKAARKIIDISPDVNFLILGDGAERKRLEQMSGELSLQKNVFFLGMVKDVSQMISLFDVAVLTSKPFGETFSNAILEYMSASKPVVATNVGSISEQVIDGETGYLVSSGNVDELSNAILKLLKDKTSAKKMGEAGRKMVEDKFTVEKMIKAYESLFVDLLEKPLHK